MKDSNKPRFEEEWRNAFEEAELPPNNDVWTRLDAHLANQESRKYRNRLVWFQRIAAGVLLLLLGSGAWLWMSRQTTGSEVVQGTDRTQRTGTEVARVEGGTGTVPADASATLPTDAASPSAQTAAEPVENGTATPGERARQAPRAATSPEALAKSRPATTAPVAGMAGERAVDLATGPALAKEKRSGTPAPGAGSAKRSPLEKSTLGRTGNPAAYLARGGRNGKSGLNDADEVSGRPHTARTPAKSLVAEEPRAGEVSATGAADGRLAVARITSRTLLAKEPVIRPRSILPHLNDAYWAKVVTEDEKVAQQADAKRERWQVGLAFAPSTFQPNFQVNENSSAYINTQQYFRAGNGPNSAMVADNAWTANRELESATAQGLSYQTGLRLEYALTRRLSVQSGVDYLYNSSSLDTYVAAQESGSNRTEPAFSYIVNYGNQAGDRSITQSESVPSVGYNSDFAGEGAKAADNTLIATPVRNVYQYVSIPARVNYQLLTKKVGATLSAGVSGDVFLSNRFGNEESQIDEVHITSTKGTAYRKLGISAWLGLKMQYRFARKYSVFLEPSYRTAVTSFTNTPALQSRPALFGVGTGLQMLF